MTASAKLSRAGRTLVVHVPLPTRQRGGRKFVVGPGGIAWTGPRVIVDNAIVKAGPSVEIDAGERRIRIRDRIGEDGADQSFLPVSHIAIDSIGA
jgi:hypothetical protein